MIALTEWIRKSGDSIYSKQESDSGRSRERPCTIWGRSTPRSSHIVKSMAGSSRLFASNATRRCFLVLFSMGRRSREEKSFAPILAGRTDGASIRKTSGRHLHEFGD